MTDKIPHVDEMELFTENSFALQAVDLPSIRWKKDSHRIIHTDAVKRVVPYVMQAIVDCHDEAEGIKILDSIIVGVLGGLEMYDATGATVWRSGDKVRIQPGALELLVQRVRPRLEKAIKEIIAEEFEPDEAS